MFKKYGKTIATVVIIVGLAILNYPTIARTINYYSAYNDIVDYSREIANTDADELANTLSLARAYNETLIGQYPKDPFQSKSIELDKRFESLPLLKEDARLGYLKIPSINLVAPVHYGTTDKVLVKNLGLLAGSSLPVGGRGSHAVISGHTGMATRKMFTDLDRVKEGDMFFIFSTGQKLAYQVDSVKIVKPENNKDLFIDADFEYVTLITCTPVGVNDHRLLVRGKRVDYDFTDEDEMLDFNSGISAEELIRLIFLVLSIAIIIVVITYTVKTHTKKQPKTKHAQKKTKS